MITTILWDVDGTLLDFLAAEKAAIRTLFAEFGFGECTDEAIARYSKINRRYWEKLENGELTKPEVLVGRFREFFETEGLDVTAAPAFNERYQVCLGDTIVFRDDSYEIVKSLRGRVKQYVVSNGTVLAQTKKLRLSGLGELMDGIFLSIGISATKKPGLKTAPGQRNGHGVRLLTHGMLRAWQHARPVLLPGSPAFVLLQRTLLPPHFV